ncbi:MAG TPA: hypothetical protein VFJ82_10415, partial [Longimicrobium sp.]|nr:hypothetical protein [Longimicrobium sp.]
LLGDVVFGAGFGGLRRARGKRASAAADELVEVPPDVEATVQTTGQGATPASLGFEEPRGPLLLPPGRPDTPPGAIPMGPPAPPPPDWLVNLERNAWYPPQESSASAPEWLRTLESAPYRYPRRFKDGSLGMNPRAADAPGPPILDAEVLGFEETPTPDAGVAGALPRRPSLALPAGAEGTPRGMFVPEPPAGSVPPAPAQGPVDRTFRSSSDEPWPWAPRGPLALPPGGADTPGGMFVPPPPPGSVPPAAPRGPVERTFRRVPASSPPPAPVAEPVPVDPELAAQAAGRRTPVLNPQEAQVAGLGFDEPSADVAPGSPGEGVPQVGPAAAPPVVDERAFKSKEARGLAQAANAAGGDKMQLFGLLANLSDPAVLKNAPDEKAALQRAIATRMGELPDPVRPPRAAPAPAAREEPPARPTEAAPAPAAGGLDEARAADAGKGQSEGGTTTPPAPVSGGNPQKPQRGARVRGRTRWGETVQGRFLETYGYPTVVTDDGVDVHIDSVEEVLDPSPVPILKGKRKESRRAFDEWFDTHSIYAGGKGDRETRGHYYDTWRRGVEYAEMGLRNPSGARGDMAFGPGYEWRTGLPDAQARNASHGIATTESRPRPVTADVFHGSAEIARRGGLEGDSFRLDIAPDGRKRKPGETVDSIGTWWTASPNDARRYSMSFNEAGERVPGAVVHGRITLENPKEFESPEEFNTFLQSLRKKGSTRPADGVAVRLALAGHDGIIVRGGGRGDGMPDGGDFYLAFGQAKTKIHKIEGLRSEPLQPSDPPAGDGPVNLFGEREAPVVEQSGLFGERDFAAGDKAAADRISGRKMTAAEVVANTRSEGRESLEGGDRDLFEPDVPDLGGDGSATAVLAPPKKKAARGITPARPDHVDTPPEGAADNAVYHKVREAARGVSDDELRARYLRNLRQNIDAGSDAEARPSRTRRIDREDRDVPIYKPVSTGAERSRWNRTNSEARLAAYGNELRARGLEEPHPDDAFRDVGPEEVPERLHPLLQEVREAETADELRTMLYAAERRAMRDPHAVVDRAIIAGEMRARGIPTSTREMVDAGDFSGALYAKVLPNGPGLGPELRAVLETHVEGAADLSDRELVQRAVRDRVVDNPTYRTAVSVLDDYGFWRISGRLAFDPL